MLDVDAEGPDLRAPATHAASRSGHLLVADGRLHGVGGIDGTVSVIPDGAGGHAVHRMYVAAHRRGSGLADLLMDAAEDAARAAGATSLSLHSDSRFARAHRFYERRSFLRRHPAAVLDDLASTVDLLYAKPLTGVVVQELDAAAAHSAVSRLATVLIECVAGGASVSFHHPLPVEQARGFWRGTAGQVAAGRVRLFAAWVEGVLAGTVTLNHYTRPNQRHRADIAKLLVAPAARRRGVAHALMARAEAAAWAMGRTLLVLDTQSGSDGDRLYRTLGWTEAGGIPGYSLSSAGDLEDMTLFYKVRR